MMNFRLNLVWFFIAIVLISHGQNTFEIDSLTKTLEKEQVDSLKIKLYFKLGLLYSNKNPNISKSYLDSGYYLAQKNNYLQLTAIANGNYGFFYYYTSNYAKALECNLLAVKYFEEQKDTNRIISTLINLGLVHFSQKHYPEALDYFNRALTLDKSSNLDKKSQRRIILNNIANIYWNIKSYRLAKLNYKKSIALGEALKDNLTIGSSCTELGELYLENNELDSALLYLKRGIEARKLRNDILGLAGSYKSLAKFYKQIKEYNLALEYLQNAFDISQKTGYLRLTSEIYLLRSSIYKEQNNYKLAFESYLNYKTTDDSIYNERITRELAQKEMQYEFDKKDKLAQLERKQTELKYLILVSILISSLIIALLLYILSQSRNKRIHLAKVNLELEKTNLLQDLEIKNRELTTNIMYLLHKNELINSISDRLFQFKKILKPENLNAFQQILTDLQSGTDDKVWEEFEYRFLQVHNGFYDRLLAKFPDLSPAEIKLCAFLRLNISTKDISAITHQNIKSIEVARSRLRKKLNITNMDVNLVNFLMEI